MTPSATIGRSGETGHRANLTKLAKGMTKITLGTKDRPIIIRTTSEEKIQKIAAVCAAYHWEYIIGFEAPENLSDLKKALREQGTPEDVSAPCPCGSGKKFKFCCAEKMRQLDVNRFIEEFALQNLAIEADGDNG